MCEPYLIQQMPIYFSPHQNRIVMHNVVFLDVLYELILDTVCTFLGTITSFLCSAIYMFFSDILKLFEVVIFGQKSML